jgi:hypothetical protein
METHESPGKPLVNQQFILQKFPGKGGWTFAEIPGILGENRNTSGWVKVKGSIDDYTFNQYSLAPMRNGNFFFPVKAEVRKKIKKQAGDYVTIRLFVDDSEIAIPLELQECLETEPGALEAFQKLSLPDKKKHIQSIFSAKL